MITKAKITKILAFYVTIWLGMNPEILFSGGKKTIFYYQWQKKTIYYIFTKEKYYIFLQIIYITFYKLQSSQGVYFLPTLCMSLVL